MEGIWGFFKESVGWAKETAGTVGSAAGEIREAVNGVSAAVDNTPTTTIQATSPLGIDNKTLLIGGVALVAIVLLLRR